MLRSLILMSLLFIGLAGAAARFCEINGVAAMEAENANSIRDWNSVDGASGTARIDAGVREEGYMSYEITFSRTGNYYVYLLCKYTGESSSEANDCIITLDGARLYGSDDVTRPDGIRTHSAGFAWSSLPKGPGSHTPDNIRNDPVYAKVTSAGTKTFKIISRSAGFVVDKIQLQRGDDERPLGLGYDQTLSTAPAVQPYFRLQPESQIVKVNRTATFTIDAGGAPVLTYQWRRNGTDIPGATEYRYRAASAQLNQNGDMYTCVVTNSFGSTVSAAARLIVYDDAQPGMGIEIEAESMDLTGYVLDEGLSNSAIKLPTGTTTGTASCQYTGAAGSRYLAVSVIPENDGAPTITMAVNGTVIKTGVYPMDAVYATPTWRIQFIAEAITLVPGDIITLTGTADLGAWARVDKIIIVPETLAGIVFGAAPGTGRKDARSAGILYDVLGRTAGCVPLRSGIYISTGMVPGVVINP